MAEQQAREAAQSSADQLAHHLARRIESDLQAYHEDRAALESEWARQIEPGNQGNDTAVPGAPQLWTSWATEHPELDLTNTPSHSVSLTAEGALSPPYHTTTDGRPPAWLIELAPAARRHWFAVQSALASGDFGQAALQLEAFLAEPVSSDARDNAAFLQTILHTQHLSQEEAGAAWRQFLLDHATAPSETGLPLGQLALLRALQLESADAGLDPGDLLAVWVQCQSAATSLIPPMLGEIHRINGGELNADTPHIRALELLIQAQDRTRRGTADFVRQHPPSTWGNHAYWFESEGEEFVAFLRRAEPLAEPGDTGRAPFFELRIYPAGIVGRVLSEDLYSVSLPRYAAALIEFGGRVLELTSAVSSPDHERKLERTRRQLATAISDYQAEYVDKDQPDVSTPAQPLLAEAQATLAIFPNADPGADPAFKVRLVLADAPLLYAQQRHRAWVFGGLIVLAAAVASTGLLAAQRAFREQLRLNDLKSTFLSSVSHELRAPIASVRLLVESLARGRITDESKRRDYFALIGQECRRLSSLIENVLDFSRIDQGRKRYEFEPTDLLALVCETARLMEPYAAERNVAIKLTMPDPAQSRPNSSESPAQGSTDEATSPATFEAILDGKALQQAVINLIDNAVKHTSTNGTVTIGLNLGHARLPSDPPSADLELWVADDGPGIPIEDHHRIFDPFYRRGSELRRETPGIGIGLTIVKHIAEAHGGRVSLESAPGKGSRFTIHLPVSGSSTMPTGEMRATSTTSPAQP